MNVDALYFRDREGRHVFRLAWTDERGEDRRARTLPAERLHGACARLEALLAVVTHDAPQVNGGAKP